jgi:hypothetical protein
MKITKKNLKDIELYLHPKQKEGCILGTDLYQHLKNENLLEDCLTKKNLEEIQKLGLKEFNNYFKDKYVFAWNSVQPRLGSLLVPYLIEYEGEVVVGWSWIADYFNSNYPALRFSKSSAIISSKLLDPLKFVLCPHCKKEIIIELKK